MDIQVWMTRLRRDDNIKAIGTVKFGEISVRNMTLMKNAKGELFLCMPSRDTGKKDENGDRIYEEIIHPTTAEMRSALNKDAIESYEKNCPISLIDGLDGTLLIEAKAFDSPYLNRVGKAQILINGEFVIKNIFINKGKNDSLYVTMPNFKSNDTHEGKPIYKEIVIMNNDLKKRIVEAVISEYKKDLGCKEQNRFSIKSRLDEAKRKASEQIHAVREHEREAVL